MQSRHALITGRPAKAATLSQDFPTEKDNEKAKSSDTEKNHFYKFLFYFYKFNFFILREETAANCNVAFD